MLLTKLNWGSCSCWIPDTCSVIWMGWCFIQCAWLSTMLLVALLFRRNSLFIVELIIVIMTFSILIRFHVPFVGMDLWFVIYGMSDDMLTLHVLSCFNVLLTHGLGDLDVILIMQCFILCYWLVSLYLTQCFMINCTAETLLCWHIFNSTDVYILCPWPFNRINILFTCDGNLFFIAFKIMESNMGIVSVNFIDVN